MKILNLISTSLLLLLLVPFTCSAQDKILVPGSCLSYEINGPQVVFHCESDMNVMLRLCSPGIIKFWYEQGPFIRNNKSFAVINEDIDNQLVWSVSEQESGYELYTSSLIIRIRKSPFQVRIYDKYQKMLYEDYTGEGFRKSGDTITSNFYLREGEAIYGLGEKTGRLNRRGNRYTMWNSDKPCYDVNEDPLYKSIPFFLSSAGYGLYFDNTYRSSFDFGHTRRDRLSFSSPGGEMIFYFIYGPTMPQIIQGYTMLTGKPIMPPAWALGFSQCRGLLTNEQLTRDIAAGYRSRQIPCDIIYQDIGWTDQLQDFNWRKGNYNNPAGMIADLDKMGFKVIVSQDPVISQSNIRQWKEADSLGFLVKDIRNGKSYDMPWPWGGNCGVVDFTNPDVSDWWGKYQQKAIDDGVRGFWTDMGEPAWSNIGDIDRLFMRHTQGMHDEIHNVYGFTWDKVVTEQFEKNNPGKRIFQMTRSAFAGMQRYTFGWSGDAGNGNDVTNGWNRLRHQIPLALSSGLCGIPFWSCDISGYCGDITDYDAMAELYVRWLQFGVFNPISRAHHEGNNAVEPWLFGSEAEKACKEAISVKYSLFPYIYTYAREAYDKGLPLMRPLIMSFPEDKTAPELDFQFMFGDNLLVAPVVEPGVTSTAVYFPEGEWISFEQPAERYKGGWADIQVNLQKIPVFVKAGAVVPMQPVLQYIGEKKDVPVWFAIYPKQSGKSHFSLYEDDGETHDYKSDKYAKTDVKCSFSSENITVQITSQNLNGYKPNAQRNSGLKIFLPEKPANVNFNGSKAKQISNNKLSQAWYVIDKEPLWSYDAASGILWIKFALPEEPSVFTINTSKS